MNIVAFVSSPEKEWTPLEGKLVEERSHDDIEKAYEGWELEISQVMQVSGVFSCHYCILTSLYLL